MSIAVLIEVFDETRRLAIAGSAVAPGDFRLKKLIPLLEKSGEKAPVFTKVAQAVSAVVGSNEKNAAPALLELTALVCAILYTQGESGMAGEMKPLETVDLGQQTTQASARILKPLLEALSTTGSGRMELIKDAQERGTFKDLRLVKPALKGLDDPYPEVGQFLAAQVLPHYGRAILPELKAKLDIKGKAGHLHRLQLLHTLDPEGSREIVQLVLGEGSKEMKVAAIDCLGTSEGDLVYLLEQSRAKAKDVRAAALRALTAASASTNDVIVALKKAVSGEDLELIISRVRSTKLLEIRQFVVEQAEAAAAKALKANDKAEQGKTIHRLQQLVACLEGRADGEAEAFLLKCFENRKKFEAIKSDPAGADLNDSVAHVMSLGGTKLQKQLAGQAKLLSGLSLRPAIMAARATMSPAAFFEEFNSLLKGWAEKRTKKNGDEFDRAQALIQVLTSSSYDAHWIYRPTFGYERRPAAAGQEALPAIDPRWLDAAVAAGAGELVCALARPGHAGANQFLSEMLNEAKKPHEAQAVLQTMVKVEHPGAVDALIDALKKLAKDSSHYYLGYWYGPMIAELPKSAAARLDEAMATFPEKMVDQLMDSVAALRNKPD